MIDLSIIIVNRNDSRFLEDCLNSVYQTVKKASFEIIFVDNGSTDHSPAIIKNKFPAVKIIANQENLGFCRANNQGLKIYRGRYALLLNVDTVTGDGAFDRLLEFMDANPKAGACGPRLMNTDGTLQHQGGLFAKKFWRSKTPVKVDYVIGACLLVRREVIDKVGGLDENFFFSNDDLDWGRRIRKAGWDIYFIPAAEVIHYGGFTIKRFNQKLMIEGFRGGLYFSKKHYGNFVYQIYRLLLIIAMVLGYILTLPLYPFLKNKGKLGAYRQILWIAIKGEIIPEYAEKKRILLVSNGHAEDLAAAAIGAGLKEYELKALPLVGLGKAYDRQGIKNLGLKAILPSGGFAKEGLKHFINDLRSGLLGVTLGNILTLRRESKNADLIVAVGDAYVAALCGLFGKKPLIFVDGPKSVKIKGYYPFELWLMKRYCKKIIVQDRETADYLQKQGLPALFIGSWVMDYVPVTGDAFGLAQEATVIGILPGTREEAYDNLNMILDVLTELKEEKFTGLIASTLDPDKLKQKGIIERLKKFPHPIRLIEGRFGDVCLRSKLIIGLAGIANEQAAAFGKPVVCFPGKGAQTTLRRWQEIHRITGDSMLILEGNASEKAEKINQLLHDPQKMEAMGRIGKASKPQWGGIKNIVKLINEQIRL